MTGLFTGCSLLFRIAATAATPKNVRRCMLRLYRILGLIQNFRFELCLRLNTYTSRPVKSRSERHALFGAASRLALTVPVTWLSRFASHPDAAAPRSSSACCGTAFGSDALREQQAVITRIFHQPSAGLYQTLPQTRQRPVGNPARQHQTPPQVPQVVRHHTQLPPHLVRPKPMKTEPRHCHRLLPSLIHCSEVPRFL